MKGSIMRVEPEQWRDHVLAAASDFPFVHSLGAVDELGRSDQIRVLVTLMRWNQADAESVQIETLVPRDHGELASVADRLPGASWYEREIREFFGVAFVGGDDTPLLQHDPTIFPLRKDFVLAARAGVSWPGAKEPEAKESDGRGRPSANRRSMAPTGVPDPQLWGQRDPDDPEPTPEQLAASLAGGRVRRR